MLVRALAAIARHPSETYELPNMTCGVHYSIGYYYSRIASLQRSILPSAGILTRRDKQE